MSLFVQKQKEICAEYGAEYFHASEHFKTGFAIATDGLFPVNGLRHPPTDETTGWYIWCGEKFSDAGDFFVPLHTSQIYEKHPEIAGFMGLPPGYRFLWAYSYLGVWFDESLLTV